MFHVIIICYFIILFIQSEKTNQLKPFECKKNLVFSLFSIQWNSNSWQKLIASTIVLRANTWFLQFRKFFYICWLRWWFFVNFFILRNEAFLCFPRCVKFYWQYKSKNYSANEMKPYERPPTINFIVINFSSFSDSNPFFFHFRTVNIISWSYRNAIKNGKFPSAFSLHSIKSKTHFDICKREFLLNEYHCLGFLLWIVLLLIYQLNWAIGLMNDDKPK